MIVRNAIAHERAGLVRIVAFYQTGTLTSGPPQLEAVVPATDGQVVEHSIDQRHFARLIRIAGAPELMRAAAGVGNRAYIMRMHTVSQSDRVLVPLPGCGVSVVIYGDQNLIGKPNLNPEKGCDVSGHAATFRACVEQLGSNTSRSRGMAGKACPPVVGWTVLACFCGHRDWWIRGRRSAACWNQ